jgi:hypothetical protein
MSDTTVGPVSRQAEGVAAYVREVRAELADLPAEDVDDLTGGMEADLSELAMESGGDLIGRLGTPQLYAAELRSAAGLPERVAGSPARRRPLGERMDQARASFALLTERHAWVRSVLAFLTSIRPAWWVLRGYLAAWALWSFLAGMWGVWPHGFSQLVVEVVAVVVSVQLGRGWMAHWAMTRPLLMLGNATAVIVALVASSAGVTSGEPSFPVATDSALQGVSLNGQQVGNIYPYDSEGRRITGVRLFAQDGRPLDADLGIPPDANGSPTGLDANGSPLGFVRDTSGTPVLNAYPHALVGPDPWQVQGSTDPLLEPPAWIPPVAIVPLAPSALPTSPPANVSAPPTGTPTAEVTPSAKATAPTPERTPKSVRPTSTAPAPSVQPTRQ